MLRQIIGHRQGLRMTGVAHNLLISFSPPGFWSRWHQMNLNTKGNPKSLKQPPTDRYKRVGVYGRRVHQSQPFAFVLMAVYVWVYGVCTCVLMIFKATEHLLCCQSIVFFSIVHALLYFPVKERIMEDGQEKNKGWPGCGSEVIVFAYLFVFISSAKSTSGTMWNLTQE